MKQDIIRKTALKLSVIGHDIVRITKELEAFWQQAYQAGQDEIGDDNVSFGEESFTEQREEAEA